MIIGLGSDVCSIARVARVLERFDKRFPARAFTPDEIAYAKGRPAAFAKRWAAKEACFKALDLECIPLRDIGVVKEKGGKPTLRLTGAAFERARALAGDGFRIHLALSDDAGIAFAVVILETPEKAVDQRPAF